jgi:hypothetical protein
VLIADQHTAQIREVRGLLFPEIKLRYFEMALRATASARKPRVVMRVHCAGERALDTISCARSVFSRREARRTRSRRRETRA